MDRITIVEKAVTDAAYSFEGFVANLIPASFFRHAAERAVQALDQAEAEEQREEDRADARAAQRAKRP